ncbi:MAG TPA: sulfite exporter TauE/SafE family protein [Phycisphaerales bacterium]|nr:sulfite exporter TauE/SafE family protein [Phycisphaerales bacterium]
MILLIVGTVFLAGPVSSNAFAQEAVEADLVEQSSLPWWAWPIILFVTTFLFGILAVLSGVGGAVLFVPIVSGFFPFHIDFVRGAGLFLAMAGSLSAGPTLLRKGIASFKLALPIALIVSASAIAGAIVGLRLDPEVIQIALGGCIFLIAIVMILAKRSEFPEVKKPDAFAVALGITGIYHEESTDEYIPWDVHRTIPALLCFIVVGFIAGMFGLGAGWANVPILNIMMGAPLKVAVASSSFLLSITTACPAWIYLNRGAVLPIIVVPSMIGIMLGSRVGVKIFARTRPASIRWVVIAMLLLASIRSITKGLGLFT